MRTIKGHTYSDLDGTPFYNILGIINIALVMVAAFWIHAFPTQYDVSPMLSLQPITVPSTAPQAFIHSCLTAQARSL